MRSQKGKLLRAGQFIIIRPGAVLLVEGRSEMSRMIKLFSNSQWRHAAIYVGNALIRADRHDRKAYLQRFGPDAEHLLVEAFSGQGVIVTPLKDYAT